MASINYEEKRESISAVAVWAVKVSFPAYGELEAKDFFWSTSKFEVDDEVYNHQLTSNPSGTHTRDRGNDYASFQASNPNNSLYNQFYPYEDLIERAEVTIKECFEIELGYFESEIRFFGYLKDFNLVERDKSLQFTAFSDLSRGGFLVGGRVLTRERCASAFPVNGVITPSSFPCGWTTAQGGNPLYCSKFLQGADGCASHNNTHRFYAITGLADAVIEVISGNGSGFPYGTEPPCFVAGTMILMADWTLKPIEKINAGDMVLAFDVFTDRLIESKVLNPLSHKVVEYEDASFMLGKKVRRFGVTREHLFFLGEARFQAYAATRGETVSGIKKDGKRARIASIGSETVSGKTVVYNFHTECGTYIVASPDKEILLKVHNIKALQA